MDTARSIVGLAMIGRVDHDIRLKPLEEYPLYAGMPDMTMGSGGPVLRHDVVLPPLHNEWRTAAGGGKVRSHWEYAVVDKLYTGFTGSRQYALSDDQILRLARSRTDLIAAMNAAGTYSGRIDATQSRKSVRLEHAEKSRSDELVAPIRIYVAAGLNGLQVAARTIAAGAQFDSAKIWSFQPARGEQHLSSDAPIFIVNTLERLHSTVRALRRVVTPGLVHEQHIVGMHVPDLPGVMIAQAGERSFNSDMASFLTAPVTDACNHADLKLQAGDQVTDQWINAAARKLRHYAQCSPAAENLHADSHALLAEQDIVSIRQAIAP